MVLLTVGYVSGIIAAGVFVCEYYPASAIMPSKLLMYRTTQCVSYYPHQLPCCWWDCWRRISRPPHGKRGNGPSASAPRANSRRTVVASTLQASYWNVILGSDASTSDGVRSVVTGETILRLTTTVILSVAGIVTPLGLYEAIVPGRVVEQPFHDANDTSTIGMGTPPRSSLGFNRYCYPGICPSIAGSIARRQNTNATSQREDGYIAGIPQNVTDAFQSGLVNLSPTVSSIWDIQWRTYGFKTNADSSIGSTYLVPYYRQLQTMILDNKVQPVEGLIVDTRSGGIGLRNHSLPPSFPYGSSWLEDLLFLEPQTACVDMNLSIEFRLANGNDAEGLLPANLSLVDRGGFAHFDKAYLNHTDYVSTEADLDLHNKAFSVAWFSNALSMFYFNVSNPREGDYAHAYMYVDSTVGKRFPLSEPSTGLPIAYDSFVTTETFGNFLNMNSSSGLFNSANDSAYPNPFRITSSNFTNAELYCKGSGGMDPANINGVGVVCGMVYGAAQRTDGGNSILFEPDSHWSTPLYSCASATRAMLKTVDLRYNGTEGLDSLSVANITDKTYARKEDQPLWGVENTTIPLYLIQPLWGLVSPQYRDRDDITVIQDPTLWLPGHKSDISWPVSTTQNLPGTQFHVDLLTAAYKLDSGLPPVADYTGKTNLAMYAKWQEYSRAATSASKIINLIWTDMAANAVLGTRGRLSDPAAHSRSPNVERRQQSAQQPMGRVSVNVPISVYDRAIQYHVPFAVPAIVVLVLSCLIMVAAMVLCVSGRARPSRIRKYLNHTSLGRTMTLLLYPEQCEPQASTKQWVKSVGTKRIDASGSTPKAADSIMLVDQHSTTPDDHPLLGKTDERESGRVLISR